jgi:hypothetical protein
MGSQSDIGVKRKISAVMHRKQINADKSIEDDSVTPGDAQLQEGLDYYLEDGLFVFTEMFLLKRGYCCESGCRHCPYGRPVD